METNITPKMGWSWGAPMFNVGFLIAIKRYHMLWWYLLAVVPFVNIIFGIAFWIYLGLKGHEIAAASTHFENQAEYDGFMKGLDHAGKVMFFVGLAVMVLVIVLIVTGFSLAALFGFSKFAHPGVSFPQGYR